MKTYIHRQMSSTIMKASQYFPVICVTGPRQSGKSTLIRHLFPSYDVYSMEDIDVRSFATNDPRSFLSQYNNGMIIDEVQKTPELLSYLQGIVDTHPDYRFVLSGSSNFTIINSISQSLAGRTAVFDLFPMTMREVSELIQENTTDEIIFNGLYPAVCTKENIPEFYYPSYIRTYLERDVRDLLKIKDLMQFNTFLRLCAGRIGSLFNASELAGEIGISVNTIKSWLSVLEASYVIARIYPYANNRSKRLVKSPKIYFTDTGLACYLLGIESAKQLTHDKMRGHLFENLIVMEFLKNRYNQGKDNNLMFYRDSNGNEIDLLQSDAGKVKAYEIKSSMTYHPSFEDVLKKSNQLVKEDISEKGIIYAGDYENQNATVKLINFRSLAR